MSKHPMEIAPHHRSRLAVAYVRQSCGTDGSEDHPDLIHQRAQVWHARAWGWPENALQVIDDVGLAGHSTEIRTGYQKPCGMVAAKQVGMVAVSDESRLTRSPATLARFLHLCRQGDVLLAIDGRLMSPHDPMCGLHKRMQSFDELSEGALTFIARTLKDLADAIDDDRCVG